MAANASYISNT